MQGTFSRPLQTLLSQCFVVVAFSALLWRGPSDGGAAFAGKLDRGADFIIAGTQKGGSSDLAKDILMKHPQILLPKKEVHYFGSCEPLVLKTWGACDVARADQSVSKTHIQEGKSVTMNTTLRSQLLRKASNPQSLSNCTVEAYLKQWVARGNVGKEPIMRRGVLVGEKTPLYMYRPEVNACRAEDTAMVNSWASKISWGKGCVLVTTLG